MNGPCTRCGTPRPDADARFCQRCGARLDAPATTDPLVGETLLHRYRVVRLLGEGSMGRVYLGEQRVGEGTRPVAIKILSSAQDAYLIARFRREAEMVATLEHPNIVKLYDYGEERGRFISVMEYLPAGSLGQLIGRGVMDPARIESILGQIARALDEAHRRGIVHRDLKPENVLLATVADGRGQQDVVKVVDFGIARKPKGSAEERTLTVTGALMGTPAYMAPEQFMAEKVDGRVDVYALALIAYQMLTGRLPWRAGSVIEWAEAHRRQPPAPLTSLPGFEHLPKRYDDAIQRALAKTPEGRTPTTLAFVDAFVGKDVPRSYSATVEIAVPAVAPSMPPADHTRDSTLPRNPTAANPRESLGPAPRRSGSGARTVTVVALIAAVSLAAGYFIMRSMIRSGTAPPSAPAASPP